MRVVMMFVIVAIGVHVLYLQCVCVELDSDGLDGVFEDDAHIDELLSIIETFQPHQEIIG